ncbi:MAG: hypothetical protein RLY93_17070, partial [Sumerlaeia bacterium]
MKRITAITGNTAEVARQHDLSINATTQRATMEVLAQLYRQDPEANSHPDASDDPEPAETDPQKHVELKLARTDARAIAELLIQKAQPNSGTNSGTRPGSGGGKLRCNKGQEKLAEREGFEPS